MIIKLQNIISVSCLLMSMSSVNGQTVFDNQKTTLNTSVSDSIFVIDRRIELFNVLQWLSKTYPAKTQLSYQYASEVEDYFGKYRSHEAVSSLDKLISFGFSYDAPISFFLHINHTLDSIYTGLPEEIIGRAGGIKNLRYFLGTVKAFSDESNFNSFYDSHESYYNRLIGMISNQFTVEEIFGQVRSYFKEDLQLCKIVLSTLTSGGFGPKVVEPDEKEIYITIASPVKLDDKGDVTFFSSYGSIQALLWHELSHPIVNPLVEKYWDSLSQNRKLISAMLKDAPNWYKDDKVINFENIVRAATIRMAHINYGQERGELNAEQQVDWGFPYSKEFSRILAIDEEKSFEFRFKHLVKSLDELDDSIQ